jgi:hypothetical protein
VVGAGAGWSVGGTALGGLLRSLQQLDPDQRARLGSAARALAARYDWDTVACSYEVAYAKVLDRMPR